jgi:hypothetical protein
VFYLFRFEARSSDLSMQIAEITGGVYSEAILLKIGFAKQINGRGFRGHTSEYPIFSVLEDGRGGAVARS